jgi:integrase/recombinase XerD
MKKFEYTKNTVICHDGEEKSIKEWEQEMGFRQGLVLQRLRQGMSEKKALTQPVKKLSPYKQVGDSKFKVKKTKMEKRLSDEEIRQFMGSFTKENFGKFYRRNKAICVILLNTGLRLNELLGLEIRDVIGPQGYKKFLDVRAEIVKGKKTSRQLKLNAHTVSALKVLVDETKVNFNDRIVTLSARQIRQIVENASVRAGLNRIISPHCFRHCAISTIYKNTKDISIAKTVAGHANTATTTDVYISPTWDDVEDAMDSLNFEF